MNANNRHYLINPFIVIYMSEKKKNIWTDFVLPVIKYAVAALIGYLTGSPEVINSIL